MRVATYTQPSALSRGSFAASALLVAAILLGSGTLPRVLPFYVPATEALITPLWLALYLGAGLALVTGQGINWVSWLVRYRILLVVLVLGTIGSIGWSLVPMLSFERTVHLVGTTLVAVHLGFTVPLLTILRTLGVVLGALLVASALAAVGLPALGIEAYEGTRVWQGVFVSKNALGFWSAVAVLLYVSLGDSVNGFGARMLCYLMAAVALVTLVFSQSATSLVCLVIGGAAALFMFVAAHFRLGFVRMAVIAVVIGGLATFAVSNIDTAELVGRSGDLTGRGEVWRQTWNLVMQRPATGFGYGVLWFPADGDGWIQDSLTDFTWTVHHAHNGFLQVASEIGLPLAVVALLMTVQQLIEIVYCQYQRQQVGTLFVLGFTVAYLVGNYSEARFLVNRELYWILFIALPISMLRQINLVAPSGAPRATGPASGAPPGGPGRGPFPTPAPAGAFVARGAAAAAAGAAGATASSSPPALAAAPAELVAGRRAGPTPPPPDPEPDFDEGDEDFFLDEVDLDATLGALTLRDADIDLGSRAASPTILDASPDEAPRDEASTDDVASDGAGPHDAAPGATALVASTPRTPDAFPEADDPIAPGDDATARFGPLDGLPAGPLKGPMNRPAVPDDVALAERDAQERAREARLGDGLDELFERAAEPRRGTR